MRRASLPSMVLFAAGMCLAVACTPEPIVEITSPAHGTFTSDDLVTVTGRIRDVPPGDAQVTVNAVPVAVAGDGSFSIALGLDAGVTFQPVLAEVTRLSTGQKGRARVVVIHGESVADGELAASSLAVRATDRGLSRLAARFDSELDEEDFPTLILGQNPIVDECSEPPGADADGCVRWLTINIESVGFDEFAAPAGSEVDLAAERGAPGYLDALVRLKNFELTYRLQSIGAGPFRVDLACHGRIQAGELQVRAHLVLSPGEPPDRIAVSLHPFIIGPNVTLVGGSHAFFPDSDSLCAGKLPDQTVLADADAAIEAALKEATPGDGGLLGGALESALAQLAPGDIDAGLLVDFDAQFSSIAVDHEGDGIDLVLHSAFTTTPFIIERLTSPPFTVTTIPVEKVVDLSASLHVPETLPVFGVDVFDTTPVGHQAYDAALTLASSAANQLLKARTETGLFRSDAAHTGEDFGEFFPGLAPETPVRLEVRPTLAPVLTGAGGPHRELIGIEVAHVLVNFVALPPGAPERLLLQVAFDARVGMDLSIDSHLPALLPSFGAVDAADVTVAVVANPAGVNEGDVSTFFPALVAADLEKAVATTFARFPLPSFGNLGFAPVEVSRGTPGEAVTLYVDLVTVFVPQK